MAAILQPGASFEEVVLPHLDAAYRLARWLLRNEHEAEDAVQEASLKALRYFRTFVGGNGRAWFLSIVRNTCSLRRGPRREESTDRFDEERHSRLGPFADPEALLLRTADIALIERAMSKLPDRFRGLLVLRELEGLSYRELADVMDIPMGTVMSRLARARQALHDALVDAIAPLATSARTGSRECQSSGSRCYAVTRRTSDRALEPALAATGALRELTSGGER